MLKINGRGWWQMVGSRGEWWVAEVSGGGGGKPDTSGVRWRGVVGTGVEWWAVDSNGGDGVKWWAPEVNNGQWRRVVCAGGEPEASGVRRR